MNPRILSGKPIIKGTRIPVYLILDSIAAGYIFQKITQACATLTPDDVKAAVEYAASILKSGEATEYQAA